LDFKGPAHSPWHPCNGGIRLPVTLACRLPQRARDPHQLQGVQGPAGGWMTFIRSTLGRNLAFWKRWVQPAHQSPNSNAVLAWTEAEDQELELELPSWSLTSRNTTGLFIFGESLNGSAVNSSSSPTIRRPFGVTKTAFTVDLPSCLLRDRDIQFHPCP
jgi:hypothetical protein